MKKVNIETFRQYPSQEKVKSLFTYKDGKLTGKKDTWYEGRVVGTFDICNPHKCKKVQIDGVQFYISRLVWIYFNGAIQKDYIIQFKDANAHNCKIENLISIPQDEANKGDVYRENRRQFGLEMTKNNSWRNQYSKERNE